MSKKLNFYSKYLDINKWKNGVNLSPTIRSKREKQAVLIIEQYYINYIVIKKYSTIIKFIKLWKYHKAAIIIQRSWRKQKIKKNKINLLKKIKKKLTKK